MTDAERWKRKDERWCRRRRKLLRKRGWSGAALKDALDRGLEDRLQVRSQQRAARAYDRETSERNREIGKRLSAIMRQLTPPM